LPVNSLLYAGRLGMLTCWFGLVSERVYLRIYTALQYEDYRFLVCSIEIVGLWFVVWDCRSGL